MRINARILAILMVLVCILTVISGCAPKAGNDTPDTTTPDTSNPATPNDDDDSSDDADSKEKVFVGATFGNIGDVFDRLLYEAMLRYVDENSDILEFQMVNATGDVNLQLSQAEQLINNGIDVMIMWAQDAEGATPAVEMANAKGIPVVCVNTQTAGGDFVYVGSDDYVSGVIQGEWLAENLPENATYCYFMGPMGHTAQIGRKAGVEDVLAEKRPDVKMLAEMPADWQRDKAMNIADDWLKAYPDVTAFVSQNDNMALGIVEALRTANRMDDIIVTGTDATEEACDSIKSGELAMSVFQNADAQGYKAVEVAVKLALGEWDEGDFDIPYEMVDSSNVDQYIEMYKSAAE